MLVPLYLVSKEGSDAAWLFGFPCSLVMAVLALTFGHRGMARSERKRDHRGHLIASVSLAVSYSLILGLLATIAMYFIGEFSPSGSFLNKKMGGVQTVKRSGF